MSERGQGRLFPRPRQILFTRAALELLSSWQ